MPRYVTKNVNNANKIHFLRYHSVCSNGQNFTFKNAEISKLLNLSIFLFSHYHKKRFKRGYINISKPSTMFKKSRRSSKASRSQTLFRFKIVKKKSYRNIFLNILVHFQMNLEYFYTKVAWDHKHQLTKLEKYGIRIHYASK